MFDTFILYPGIWSLHYRFLISPILENRHEFHHETPCTTQGSTKMESLGNSEASCEASLGAQGMANMADVTRK